MDLSDLIDRPIAFQRSFVRLTKSINASLFLSQAVYWSKRTDDSEGWFYKRQSEWEDETGLTRREQDTARKTLRELGVMEEVLEGIPATLHFRVNFKTLRTRLAECAIPVCTKTPTQIGGKRQTTNNAETTSETTTQKGRFTDFWEAYPRKEAKGNAEKAFKKVDVHVDILIEAIEAQKKSEAWRKEGGAFIPHPATWLNSRRWEDEPMKPIAPTYQRIGEIPGPDLEKLRLPGKK